jgi:hypothetical protein
MIFTHGVPARSPLLLEADLSAIARFKADAWPT